MHVYEYLKLILLSRTNKMQRYTIFFIVIKTINWYQLLSIRYRVLFI
jgi:hypothetical protein